MTENFTPLARQAVALACPAFELMYGGQKGGGKSIYLCICWVPLLSRAHQRKVETGRDQMHCRIPIFRKNLDDLHDIIAKSHRVYPLIDPSAVFNKNTKTWTFWSGATVEFHHLDGPQDHEGWNGQEIMGAGFDQVEQIEYKVYAYLIAQVRTADEHYKDLLMVRSTANPGGRHGDWVRDRFIKPCPEGNKVLIAKVKLANGTEQEVTRAFIPSALKDNHYLNADGMYEARLRDVLPEHQIKQFLEGDWNVVVGAFFSSRVRPEVHFCDSHPISPTWDVQFGLDWGSAAPAATLWGARDNDDRIYIIDELYTPGDRGRIYGEKMAKKVARQQWSSEKKWAIDEFWGSIDHQATGKYGSEGATAAAGIASHGFRIFPANKDRDAGIQQIFERFTVRADGKAGVVIFKDRCPNLCRALMTVRTDPRNSEEYDRDDGDAHSVDAFRFLLMEWPVKDSVYRDPRDEAVDKFERYLKQKSRRAVEPSNEHGIYTGYDA